MVVNRTWMDEQSGVKVPLFETPEANDSGLNMFTYFRHSESAICVLSDISGILFSSNRVILSGLVIFLLKSQDEAA